MHDPAYPHDFVNITLVPIDARLTADGHSTEFAEAPDRQLDNTPEQVCRVCFAPLDTFSLKADCAGPSIPNDISGLTDTQG